MSSPYNIAFEACKILGFDVWPKDLMNEIYDLSKKESRKCANCPETTTWHRETWSNNSNSYIVYQCQICGAEHYVRHG